jgi:hypothetical protein
MPARHGQHHQLATHAALGFSWVAIDSDLSILRKTYQSLLSDKP